MSDTPKSNTKSKGQGGGNKARPRLGARVAAVQALFQSEAGGENAEAIIQQFIQHRLGALPGEGVSVIVGHNTLDAEEAGPFAAIGQLEEGDRFFVLDAEGKLMTFEVDASGKIGARDAAALEKAAVAYENTLTLLTCEDELPEGGYASRRIVSAKRVEEIRP